MSTETMTGAAVAEHNRTVARRWIDAFNARDEAAEAAARTGDYIAHAPDSIQTAALDSVLAKSIASLRKEKRAA